jgi:hypothetical protein
MICYGGIMDSYTEGFRKLAEDARKNAAFCRKTAEQLTNVADKAAWLREAGYYDGLALRYEEEVRSRESAQQQQTAVTSE